MQFADCFFELLVFALKTLLFMFYAATLKNFASLGQQQVFPGIKHCLSNAMIITQFTIFYVSAHPLQDNVQFLLWSPLFSVCHLRRSFDFGDYLNLAQKLNGNSILVLQRKSQYIDNFPFMSGLFFCVEL